MGAMSHKRQKVQPELPQQILDEIYQGRSSQMKRARSNLAAERRQRRKTARLNKNSTESKSHTAARNPTNQPQSRATMVLKHQIAALSRNKAARSPSDLTEDFGVRHGDSVQVGVSPPLATGSQPYIGRTLRDKFDEDDAEIAALERKLGKRSSKSHDRGIQGLLGDLGGLNDLSDIEHDTLDNRPSEQEQDSGTEEWLRSKRLKTAKTRSASEKPSVGAEESDSFDGFSSSDSDDGSQSKVFHFRENPYVAPVTTKYVPPSLRHKVSNTTDGCSENMQLRRNLRGILNKLSAPNMLSLLREVDHIFRQNTRNEVSSIMIDLILNITCDQAVLNDTFIIDQAGFVAALYRMIGTDFGAKFVQHLVEKIDITQCIEDSAFGKESSNLIGLLAELYNFHVVGSKLLYDTIRILVSHLTEETADILLRITKSSGYQLRQDDPTSLSTVMALLQESMRQQDSERPSIRKKLLIEMITNLKNNRLKVGLQANTVRTEHSMRMKKILASLHGARGLSARPTEPLQVGFDDIRHGTSRGKWWLVGAAYSDSAQLSDHEDLYSTEREKITPVDPIPGTASQRASHEIRFTTLEIPVVARSLGMNTDVRRTIFASVMTATSLDDAYTRIQKLNLKKRQYSEVATVLSRCAAAEKSYNPFHAALARKLASQREIRKALWNPLIEILTRLDEDAFDQEDDQTEHRWWTDPQAQYNLAQFFGHLIADEVISIVVFKNRDILAFHAPSTTFLELLMVKVLISIGKERGRLREVFAPVVQGEGTPFAEALRTFFEIKVSNSKFADNKGEKTVRRSSAVVVALLRGDASSV